MNRRMILPAALLPISLAVSTPVHAADYQGAAAILQQIPAASSTSAAPSTTDLRSDIDTFKRQEGSLADTDAATQWIDLVKRWSVEAPHYTPGAAASVNFFDVMSALPPPSVWPEVKHAARALEPSDNFDEAHVEAIRLLADTLVDDRAGQSNDDAALEHLQKANPSDQFLPMLVEGYNDAVLQSSDDPDFVLKAVKEKVDDQAQNGGTTDRITLPDLATLVGEPETKSLLTELFTQCNVSVSVSHGAKTLKLAQDLALQLAPRLKAGQWGLVTSLDSAPLYDAMAKRFADTPMDPLMYDRQQAKNYYLFALIAHGRDDEATQIAVEIGQNGQADFSPALKEMDTAGYSQQIYSFLYKLLSKHPELSYWDLLNSTAAAAGKTPDVLALVKSAIANPNLTSTQVIALKQQLYKTLLADDKADEAVSIMEKLAADASQSTQISKAEIDFNLTELGILLDRPDWRDRGLAACEKDAADPNQVGNTDMTSNVDEFDHNIVDVLLQLGRGPEAEKLLGDVLKAQIAQYQSNPQTQQQYIYQIKARQLEMQYVRFRRGFDIEDYGGGMTSGPGATLLELASLYSRTGRDADVIYLVDHSPDWGAGDLSSLYLSDDSVGEPFGYIVAKALANSGDKERAVTLLQATLRGKPGFDPGYELLLSLQGDQALPFLDEMFAGNQFEKRPLIWKAEQLRRDGKLADAEAIARKAIAIDPSDGNSRHGMRMRAFAELADILTAEGDTKQATDMRNVVDAIRIAEKADDFRVAGLLTHAISLYNQALTHFADAYCIQSRIALQYVAMGDYHDAEIHYRRAYELMPSSFGRIESHCFGCEGVFDGPIPQSIADQVFTKLDAEEPSKPQVHYLLGYLREQQGRDSEAAAEFEKAVALDPDYINAWIHLGDDADNVHLDAAHRDAIAINLLRLDPSGASASSILSQTSDLGVVYKAGEEALKRAPAPESPSTLYAMPLSQAELDEAEKSPSPYPGINPYAYEYASLGSSGAVTAPGQFVGENSVLTLIGTYLAGPNPVANM